MEGSIAVVIAEIEAGHCCSKGTKPASVLVCGVRKVWYAQ